MIFDFDRFADLIVSKLAARLERSWDEVLTTRQAAKFLQVNENTVLDHAARGLLPGRKVGRDWRFLRSELLDHIRTKRGS